MDVSVVEPSSRRRIRIRKLADVGKGNQITFEKDPVLKWKPLQEVEKNLPGFGRIYFFMFFLTNSLSLSVYELILKWNDLDYLIIGTPINLDVFFSKPGG